MVEPPPAPLCPRENYARLTENKTTFIHALRLEDIVLIAVRQDLTLMRCFYPIDLWRMDHCDSLTAGSLLATRIYDAAG